LYFEKLNIDPDNPRKIGRDIFLLSKGHAVSALYATLARRGFLPQSDLKKYGENGGKMAGHVTLGAIPGVEATAGSLGHGLPMACGFILASKMDKIDNKVFCLLGDGECNEGSVWEAIMFAAHNKLNNLFAIVDHNGLQGMGNTKDILDMGDLANKWASFGWEVAKVNDGHNFGEIEEAFMKIKESEKPKVIILQTIKGKGVSWMENNNDWHYKTPNEDQFLMALQEIEKS
jgi:transketolase